MKDLKTRRWLAATAAVCIGLTAQTVGVSTASASSASNLALTTASTPQIGDQTCRGELNRYTICFSLTQIGVSRDFAVHIGIDVFMSQTDAQNIINAPGEELSARIFGEDTFFDNGLKAVPVTWAAANAQGLSAEFDTTASGSLLNEDWEGDDEIYGLVSLYVPSTGSTRTFRTNTVVDSFELYT